MYNTNRKDYYCLLNLLDAIEKIKQFSSPFNSSSGFFEDIKAFDACLMNFIVIGEMADKLSEELKNITESEIEWYKIKGFRNILAHDYFGVNAEEVWQIIHNDLPDLEIKIKKLTE